MSATFDKIAASKRSVRRDVAKLSFDKKLQILETLRTDGIGFSKICPEHFDPANADLDLPASALARLLQNIDSGSNSGIGAADNVLLNDEFRHC